MEEQEKDNNEKNMDEQEKINNYENLSDQDDLKILDDEEYINIQNEYGDKEDLGEHEKNLKEFEKIAETAEEEYSQDLAKLILKVLVVMIIISVYMLIPRTFWLIPSKHSSEKINPYEEPVMIMNDANIKTAEQNIKPNEEQLIEIKSLKNKKTYYLLPLAEYSNSSRLKEKNSFFFLQWDIDKVALMDYGLVWGDMAKKSNFKKINAHSNQTVMARGLVYNLKIKNKHKRPMDEEYKYLQSHVSHTHIIPADKKILKALKAVKPGQIIKLDGYLVDVYDSDIKRFAMTSLSLTDTNETARGGGACEIMYVTKVQVGKKVFE